MRGRERTRYQRRPSYDKRKIIQILEDVQQRAEESYEPIQLENLNAFERKKVHQFFEDDPDFETRTYRSEDERFVLWVYPVGKLRAFAEEKAMEAKESGKSVALPPMSSYERFLVHSALKEWGDIETLSEGEGENRHVVIHPMRFGRRLKRIAKRIKLI
jgi:predicted RNA-binding protein Jag